MTFTKGVKGYATAMGVRPPDAARALAEDGADAVGANCGGGFEQMIEVMSAMRPATDLPLWAKANAGLPELVAGKTVYRQTPEQMAGRLSGLVGAGARVAGGCCGTTPEHIAALRASRARAPCSGTREPK
jgi:5-methyltetrahydrofolate--homocysteine methyltransferase